MWVRSNIKLLVDWYNSIQDTDSRIMYISAIQHTSYCGGFTALCIYLASCLPVLGGYHKFGTIPDITSSPGSHCALLKQFKIILWHRWLDLCEGPKLSAPPGLSTKNHTYGAMPPSTSMTVCIQVNILLKKLSNHSVGCFCWGTLWWRRGMEKGIKTTVVEGVRLYDLLNCHWYTLWFVVVNQRI